MTFIKLVCGHAVWEPALQEMTDGRIYCPMCDTLTKKADESSEEGENLTSQGPRK